MTEGDPRNIELKELQSRAIFAKDAADNRWKDNQVLSWFNRLSELMDSGFGTGLTVGTIVGLAVVSLIPQDPSLNGIGKSLLDALPELSGGLGGIMLGKGLKPVSLVIERRKIDQTLENVVEKGVKNPDGLAPALVYHDQLPSISEVRKWTVGDVKAEHREDPRFTIVKFLSDAMYKEEKNNFQKAKEARQNARFKAIKLFWEATILAQQIREKTSHMLEKSLTRGLDVLVGVGAGIGFSKIIEVAFQNNGIAVLGGLVDDIWVLSVIGVKSYLPRTFEFLLDLGLGSGIKEESEEFSTESIK